MIDEGYTIKDSGERLSFGTGAVRDTTKGKGRYDLLSPFSLKRLAIHMQKGADKYEARNWEKGIPLSRFFDSAVRHLQLLQAGETDEDHLAAAFWNIHGYIHTEEMIKRGLLPGELADMPKYYPILKEGMDFVESELVNDEKKQNKPICRHYGIWDQYFFDLCIMTASKSNCLSRQIGAIIVKDKSIVSLGFNGPPRGTEHCDTRKVWDHIKRVGAEGKKRKNCPRKVLEYKSGEGLHLCPAAHAETNAVANAARLGVNCSGAVMYMNCSIPCARCAGTIINAGISEIVVESLDGYDVLGLQLFEEAGVKVRVFDLEGE